MLQSRNVYNVYTILSINYSFFCSVMFIYPMRYIWRRQLPREYHCFFFQEDKWKTPPSLTTLRQLAIHWCTCCCLAGHPVGVFHSRWTRGELGGAWSVEPARHQALVEPARQGDDGAISALAGSMQEQQIALEVAGRCSRIGINIWY